MFDIFPGRVFAEAGAVSYMSSERAPQMMISLINRSSSVGLSGGWPIYGSTLFTGTVNVSHSRVMDIFWRRSVLNWRVKYMRSGF